MPFFEEIKVDYDPGTTTRRRAAGRFDDHAEEARPRLRSDQPLAGARSSQQGHREQLFLTGLIYFDQSTPPFDEQMNLVSEPLATLPESQIRPPASALSAILESSAESSAGAVRRDERDEIGIRLDHVELFDAVAQEIAHRHHTEHAIGAIHQGQWRKRPSCMSSSASRAEMSSRTVLTGEVMTSETDVNCGS